MKLRQMARSSEGSCSF